MCQDQEESVDPKKLPALWLEYEIVDCEENDDGVFTWEEQEQERPRFFLPLSCLIFLKASLMKTLLFLYHP